MVHKHPGHTKKYTKLWKRIRKINNQIGNLKGDAAQMDKDVKKLRKTRSRLMRRIHKTK